VTQDQYRERLAVARAALLYQLCIFIRHREVPVQNWKVGDVVTGVCTRLSHRHDIFKESLNSQATRCPANIKP
jgi:hypothetical protein